eukprot:TRINITY_DN5751_c0_g1_i2.p1 TRINITY_DN5751_c0_g1~~TRINITY_DN5751_c0_g1_i2.p1  ORF type:complete len:152 (-),score=17.27 TRINITY_DN5751_c0_g1_i2:37-492(-)
MQGATSERFGTAMQDTTANTTCSCSRCNCVSTWSNSKRSAACRQSCPTAWMLCCEGRSLRERRSTGLSRRQMISLDLGGITMHPITLEFNDVFVEDIFRYHNPEAPPWRSCARSNLMLPRARTVFHCRCGLLLFPPCSPPLASAPSHCCRD